MSNWAELLEKYRNGELTIAEELELQEHIKESPLKERQHKEVKDPLLMFREHPELLDIDTKRGWEKLVLVLTSTGRIWKEQQN